MDWCNKEEVIKYAQSLGTGLVVFKHADRDNFNIVHAERMAKYPEMYPTTKITVIANT